jgi:cobalt-zinc-cadmium efflux system protein
MKMTLHGVPPGVNEQAVRKFLEACPGVCALHDLHIWQMSTTETALTCHLIIPEGHPGDAELRRITDQLRDHFSIPHATLQIETDEGDCALHGHAA